MAASLASWREKPYLDLVVVSDERFGFLAAAVLEARSLPVRQPLF